MECAKCRKVIKKNGLPCGRCGRAWHPSCAGFKHGGRGARSHWPSGQCHECSFAPPAAQPQPQPEQQQHLARRSPGAASPRASPGPQGQDQGHQPWHQPQRQYYGPEQHGYDDDLQQQQQQFEDDDDDDGWQRYSRIELELMEKCVRLETENRRRKDESGRLADELHRLRDTTRINIMAVRRLRIRQEVQSQEQFGKVLEIRNLFQRPDEDLMPLVLRVLSLVLAQSQGQDAAPGPLLTEADVDTVVRLPYGALGPKPVTVALRDKARWEEVLRRPRPVRWDALARSAAEPLQEGEAPDELVFVNAYLTPYFRRLLRLCRSVCRRVGIQFCWYRPCRVLLRYPAAAAKPLAVEAPEDLLRLLPDSMRHVVESEIAADKSFRDKQLAVDKGDLADGRGGARPRAPQAQQAQQAQHRLGHRLGNRQRNN